MNEIVNETIDETEGYVLDIMDFLTTKLVDILSDFGIKLVMSILIYFIGGQLIKYTIKVVNIALKKSKLDIALVKFIDSLISTILRVLMVILIIDQFTDLTPIIATLGAVGIGVGMALQGGLANFVGGLLILFNKPFTIGDLVEESTYGNLGFVEDIQIFHSVLRTFDNKTVIIPNGNLANGCVINYNKQKERRVDLKIGVSYDSDIETVKRVIWEVVNSNAMTIKDKENVIRLDEHGDSSLVFNCFIWCKTTDYFEVKYSLLEDIKNKFDKEKIEIPYPHMDVNIINQ